MPSTTALLLSSLDVIHLGLSKMQEVIADASVSPASVRAVKASIHKLRTHADQLTEWLDEARLETTTH